MRGNILSIALSLLILAPLTGCSEDETQYGDLLVEYRVGSGSTDCEAEGIEFLRVYIMASETTVFLEETFTCDADSETVLFEDVEVGTYTIRVEGLDGDNNIIFTGDLTREVEVEANQTNEAGPVVLSQIRPSILLWFDFDEAGNCARFEVEEVEVVLYRDATDPIFREVFECSERLADSLLIEDLSDDSTYDLRVRGTNDNSEYTYAYDEDDIEVSMGAPEEITAELSACDDLCTAP